MEKIIDYMEGYEDIPPQNAIRIFLENGSWLAIRPSGTEPKIKFYFYSTGQSRQQAIDINKDIRNEVFGIIEAVE